MSTISTTVTTIPAAAEPAARPHPVRRAVLASGAIAATATTAAAAVAEAAGIPLAIDGETIPLLGFAQLTLIGAVLGGLIAVALNRYSTEPQRWFLSVAVVLTALSCVPSVTLPPDTATKAVLVATHVLAAVIIVPALAHQTHR